MKATKFIVLVGGILGILSFFLPMVSVTREGKTASVSAFQIVKGLDAVGVEVDKAGANREISVETSASAKKDIGALKGIVMAIFGPAALLALIGAIGVARKRFGRVAASFSLVFGLIGLAIAGLLKSAAEGDSGIGLTMLLLTGLAGVVGGIMALAKPERPVAAKTAFATVPTRMAA